LPVGNFLTGVAARISCMLRITSGCSMAIDRVASFIFFLSSAFIVLRLVFGPCDAGLGCRRWLAGVFGGCGLLKGFLVQQVHAADESDRGKSAQTPGGRPSEPLVEEPSHDGEERRSARELKSESRIVPGGRFLAARRRSARRFREAR